jgi:hypothetical protein
MASAGTLLSDLESKSPVFNKDDDLVNKILADMNVPSPSNPIITQQQQQHSMPPPSGTGRVINAPNPNSTYPVAIDPGTATAHMIGKDYPTAADFAQLMHSSALSHGGSPFAGLPQQAPIPQPTLIESTKGNMYTDIITQSKQPLLVAIIVLLVSLPIINVLIGHYLPSLLRIGGDLTTAGLVVKALIGGFLFWFIQKVLVPLMVV